MEISCVQNVDLAYVLLGEFRVWSVLGRAVDPLEDKVVLLVEDLVQVLLFQVIIASRLVIGRGVSIIDQ